MLNLRVNLIDNKATLPRYSHPGDAGLDLFACERKELPPGKSVLVKTGITIELPKDTEAQIRPRSGLALQHQITVLNSPGTIDCGYRGEIGVILINHGEELFVVEEGMKIAQLVVAPILRVEVKSVEQLLQTERGGNGFGSTGKY